MEKTLEGWVSQQADGGRVFAQEQLIAAVAEQIWEQMDKQQKTKTQLATTLGKSKAYLTQVLNGSRNMTLRTLSDIAFALGVRVDVELRPAQQSRSWEYDARSSIGRPSSVTTSDSFAISQDDIAAAANDVTFLAARPVTRAITMAEVA